MAPRGQNHKRKRERDRSLVENERAIEGLPIRLVIALFVGVAALFLMLQVLDLFDEDDLDRSEITIEIQEGATLDLDDDTDELEFTVIDGNGQELEEGEDFEGVIFQPDTALGETGFFTDDDGFIELNGDDGTYSTNVGEIISELDTRLGAGQNTGTYEIVPEAGGDFDEEVPIEITLVD